jgi:hypothetical protein
MHVERLALLLLLLLLLLRMAALALELVLVFGQDVARDGAGQAEEGSVARGRHEECAHPAIQLLVWVWVSVHSVADILSLRPRFASFCFVLFCFIFPERRVGLEGLWLAFEERFGVHRALLADGRVVEVRESVVLERENDRPGWRRGAVARNHWTRSRIFPGHTGRGRERAWGCSGRRRQRRRATPRGTL